MEIILSFLIILVINYLVFKIKSLKPISIVLTIVLIVYTTLLNDIDTFNYAYASVACFTFLVLNNLIYKNSDIFLFLEENKSFNIVVGLFFIVPHIVSQINIINLYSTHIFVIFALIMLITATVLFISTIPLARKTLKFDEDSNAFKYTTFLLFTLLLIHLVWTSYYDFIYRVSINIFIYIFVALIILVELLSRKSSKVINITSKILNICLIVSIIGTLTFDILTNPKITSLNKYVEYENGTHLYSPDGELYDLKIVVEDGKIIEFNLIGMYTKTESDVVLHYENHLVTYQYIYKADSISGATSENIEIITYLESLLDSITKEKNFDNTPDAITTVTKK